MFDGKAFGEQMVEVVRQYVANETATLLARIAELEKRQPEPGKDGRDGADGRDGKDGADGRDAEPVSDEQIAAAVERYLIDNPPAAGKDGANGKDGAPGADADMDVLKSHCEGLIATLPKPENGKDGRDGIDGKDGEKGENGQDGKDGADGVGLAGAMIDRDGELNVTLTNGEVRKLGPVVGKDGRDGERGPEGFSLTDFDTDWRPEDKVLILSWDAGEHRYSHELFIPYLRDCGVWTEGANYLKGDGVTWGGSFWTAQDDTSEKPDGSKYWRLAVKKGRDGKDFAGPQPKPSEKVRI